MENCFHIYLLKVRNMVTEKYGWGGGQDGLGFLHSIYIPFLKGKDKCVVFTINNN